jgi:hypothetical protein
MALLQDYYTAFDAEASAVDYKAFVYSFHCEDKVLYLSWI